MKPIIKLGSSGRWFCISDNPTFIGIGPTPEAAWNDWAAEVKLLVSMTERK